MDFGEIVTVLQREIELALTELTAIDRSMFVAQNEAYLASLFPNGAKPSDNGEPRKIATETGILSPILTYARRHSLKKSTETTFSDIARPSAATF
jgi:hypothetical protein